MKRLLVILALMFVSTASAATFIGNDYRNVINGTWSADYIEARGGNDSVYGKGGSDDILCGNGHDECFGGQGADYVTGGAGNDRVYAGCNGTCNAGANNNIFGGDGDDVIGADNNLYDKINCGPGYDHVWYDIGLDDVESCENYQDFGLIEEPTVSTETG